MAKVVFVGNISYDITEQQLIDIFSAVGPVHSFRLVFDKDTGRPKGYGFCEYHDEEAAASAVRNLNNHVINNRNLRVDFTHESAGQQNTQSNVQQMQPAQMAQASTLPGLPPGQLPPPNLPVTDAIGKTLSTIPPAALMDILSQLKGVVMTAPDQAEMLLKQSPQLAYAAFQAMLLMDVVDAQILTRVISSNPSAPSGRGPPPLPPQVQSNYGSSTPIPPPNFNQPPPPPIQTPQSFGKPPFQGYPPQIRSPQPPQTPQPAQPPMNHALIQQVLSLSDSQIQALPPDQRQVILCVKQRIMSGQM